MLKAYAVIFTTLIGAVIEARSQDPQFSQFYAAPLYLNPAFAGSAESARVGINYRNQWPSYPTNFVTYSGYFDYFFEDYNSGVGILLLSDVEGLAGLKTNSVVLQYSYQLRITDNLIFRPGLQGSYTMQNIDNLLTPVNSLITGDSQLDRKYSVHLGYKFLLPTATNLNLPSGYRDISLTPTVQYKQQGQFSQLDAGLYFTYEPFVFGTWYRGLPFKPVEGISNNESLIFLAGISSNGLHIGYSFDYTISQLGISTGGAHEVSIRYEFFLGDPRKPPKNVRQIPCPKF
jgi:hypothetical protein